MSIEAFTDKICFERPSGKLYANVNGTVEEKNPDDDYLETEDPQLQPTLNAGWLLWDRKNTQFRVRSMVNGFKQIKPMRTVDLIKGGRLFFEDIESLISLEREKHWAAIHLGSLNIQTSSFSWMTRILLFNLLRSTNPLSGRTADLFPET